MALLPACTMIVHDAGRTTVLPQTCTPPTPIQPRFSGTAAWHAIVNTLHHSKRSLVCASNISPGCSTQVVDFTRDDLAQGPSPMRVVVRRPTTTLVTLRLKVPTLLSPFIRLQVTTAAVTTALPLVMTATPAHAALMSQAVRQSWRVAAETGV